MERQDFAETPLKPSQEVFNLIVFRRILGAGKKGGLQLASITPSYCGGAMDRFFHRACEKKSVKEQFSMIRNKS